jgi:hypothetical protein
MITYKIKFVTKVLNGQFVTQPARTEWVVQKEGFTVF